MTRHKEHMEVLNFFTQNLKLAPFVYHDILVDKAIISVSMAQTVILSLPNNQKRKITVQNLLLFVFLDMLAHFNINHTRQGLKIMHFIFKGYLIGNLISILLRQTYLHTVIIEV